MNNFYRGMSRGHHKHPGPARPIMNLYTKRDLQLIEVKKTPDLIKIVSSELKKFQCTLESKDFCKNNFDIIISLLVKVSSGLTDVDDADIRERAIKILGEVFSERCLTFHTVLKQCVGDPSFNLASVCDFFAVLLEKLPDSTSQILPVDELHQTVSLLSEEDMLDCEVNLLPKAKLLLELRKARKDQYQVKRVKKQECSASMKRSWDNNEYRTVQILPKWEEINTPTPPFQLRPNIVDGKYDDWLHYYDIQFRLLREDFISPLRKGIGDYIHGKVGRDLRNVRAYYGVRIVRSLCTRAGLCHAIKFDTAPFKRYNWDHSKRLIFGSMLCLSPDNFHSEVFFATVSKSEPRKLAWGRLEVMFQGSTKLLAHIKLQTNFVMIESMAYFEASRHILRSLQVAEIATMPFTPYLISNDCAVVNPPNYLNSGEEASTYDIQFILKKRKSRMPHGFTNVTITDSSQWPTLQMTELDESQLKALQMALTQEIAVIQGPPGTGKTYIGLKIVQALLKNRHVWNSSVLQNDTLFPLFRRQKLKKRTVRSPILVMCFTNHALDQFLEGILDMHDGNDLTLVRIGGRCKNEKIQECSLFNVKKKLKNIPQKEYKEMREHLREAEEEGGKCNLAAQSYHDPKHNFVGFSEIKCVIDQYHYWSLLENSETVEEEQIAMELWLGLYIKEVHEEYIPVEEKQEETESDSSDSDEERSSEDYSSSTEEDEDQQDKEPIITITGEGRMEKDNRMIDGMTEMFEEMNFDSGKLPFIRKKVKKVPQYNIRRTFKIIKCHNHYSYHLKRHIMKQSAMSEREVSKIQDIHNIRSAEDRYKLYMYWHAKYRKHLVNELEDKFKAYNEKCDVANRYKQRMDRYVLEAADVIGMTTTGAAKYQQILHLVKPKIVIVEEAAEVLESHIVSALNADTQHLILIGDHEQLRPNPNDYDLAIKYKLDISLFERLVMNRFPHATLQIQHRMRPQIADLVRNHIYDVLHDHESVTKYPKVKGVSSNLFLIQHSKPEKGSELSHSNEFEAAYLAALCKFLLQQGYEPTQITLLVTYTGQLLLIRNYMPKATFEGVRVSTVDNFQGEENDIILLSLVRSNENGVIGFLKAKNRVCVALSRAKHGFYCIGNFNMLRKGAEVWEKIVSDMESKGMVGESLSIHCNNHPDFMKRAKSPGDFAKHFPTGGCMLPCEFRLKCGHVCAQTCHSSDPEHEKYKCKKPCNQPCPEGHACNRFCYEVCKCTELVLKTLPRCGHLQETECYQDPKDVLCKTLCVREFPLCGHSQEMWCYQRPEYRNVSCHSECEKSCPKGHPCPLLCSQRCQPCQIMSTVELPVCGHMQDVFCHQKIADIKCKVRCEKKCKSGHPCPLKCYRACQPCKTRVTKEFVCGHSAKVQCSEYADILCSFPCTKKLICGHKCPSTCGQPCLDASCTESIEITLPRCGHKSIILCSKKDNHLYRSRLKCSEPCEKKLPCGHTCTGICGAPCIERCKVGVKRTCPQGHQLLQKCFETFTVRPCDKACKRKLGCGHHCQNLCSETCTTECEFPTLKKYPCGHQHRLPCSSPIEEHPCDIFCRAPLACGHNCRGKCSDCRSTRIHKPCEYFVIQRHFCGEEIEMKCVGLQDSHESKSDMKISSRLLHCAHDTILYDQCRTDLYECKRPCQWSCEHYSCTKLCHEICDRPPCDNKCPELMGCGHPCIGLCGEPCIDTCPLCDPERFVSQLVTPGSYSVKQAYTQLPCGHIFTVHDMDKRAADRPSSVVGPLQCPECSSPLSCSFRYGNLVKKSLLHVEAVKLKVNGSAHLSAEEKDQLNRVFRFSLSNVSQQTLNDNPDVFKPLQCMLNLKTKLSDPTGIVSREEGFVFLLLTKVFAYSCSDIQSFGEYQDMLTTLLAMIDRNKVHQLSFQVCQDLISELYLLCYQAKLSVCQQRFSSSVIKPLQNFLRDYDNPSRRVSKRNFTAYSKQLDSKLSKKRITVFESTDELIRDIERFQPVIMKGRWQMCDSPSPHYYCVPVCKPGIIKMQCPECTGIILTVHVQDSAK